MDSTVVVVIVVGAAVLVALLVAVLVMRRRGGNLKDRFGPEYERAVDRAEDKSAAEADLQRRLDHRGQLEITTLPHPARDHYRERWFELQKGFVDRPREAVIEADGLISEIMHARGYPVDDFERRADDISVDHPDIVEHYRRGHGIASRGRDGLAGTEELREAVLDYRRLFERLVEAEETAS